MELKKIDIKNFRSIKDATIEFDQNCKVLVGKNEAGKSNVLKAIAAVFDEYPISAKDKRKKINNEKISPDQYYIMASFNLDEDDFSDIMKLFQKNYGDLDIVREGFEKEIFSFLKKYFQTVVRIIKIEDKAVSYKAHYVVPETGLSNFIDVIFEYNSIKQGIATDANNVTSAIFKYVKEHWEEWASKCYYWSFDNSHLLPNTVNILKFKANPMTCHPLKNVFELCNRENIQQQFNNAFEEDGDFDNLLEQVSDEVTSIFQEIWGDFKNTQIELRSDGGEIRIKIKEKAKYNFEDRSDGFKRFISILLMISTRVRKEEIDDLDIILFDEPDQSLYPTSARYLRDELLKLSEKTKIIYSTHSQYMIDSDCVERHIVVAKKDDITSLQNYNSISPFSDDELLRNTIGTSVFECLKENNIIFEGWLDKQLFELYLKFNPTKLKKFENVGRVFLSGISSVETLVQILILANKKFVIVADSDQTSNNKKTDFIEKFEEYSNCWISYSDVNRSIETMEDFIKSTYIENKIKETHREFKFKSSLSSIKNIESVFKNKNEKQTFKKNIVSALTKGDIEADFSKVIELILTKINNK